ncbi:MAG: ArsR family transcriptional regulator [Motiliproteus sp.]|nr:ArsR family transcriptional regulator [Motiliproteus sp.]MCW9054285.1 ArsR family transcriptional regulator [Motiliproteus sp.]
MATSKKILNLLNRQPMTVSELSEILSITRNSTHLQLTRLEAAGQIRRKAQRRSESAGKPAYEYELIEGNEDVNSQAYKPLNDSLLETLAGELPDQERRKLLRKAGRLMAQKAGLKPQGDVIQDLTKAVDVVNELGAMAEISSNDSNYLVTSYSCPVATSVRCDSETCSLVAAFFSEATDRNVISTCQRQKRLVCQFELERE